MPLSPVFVDTNIWVYTYDTHEPRKYTLASAFLSQVLNDKTVVISSQVITEFCNVMTTKKGTLMTIPDLQLIIQEVLGPALAHLPSLQFYTRAVDLKSQNSISFYDALIIQAAIDLGCKTLYSEDLQEGQQFGVLKIVNPFK